MNEGRTYVYHGSAGGLVTSPAWTAESDQEDAWFGHSVATAGDVNSDGFSDVIIGADWYANGEDMEGRAFVYHGFPAGLAASPAWTAESNIEAAFFAYSVSAAGDVNGDGFCDVIVGQRQSLASSYLYYGNVGPCRNTHPRQQRTDGVTPVAPLCRSDSETEFRIRAIMNSPYGRTALQMEHEVKPFDVPFNGQNTVTDLYFDTGPDGAVEVDRLVSGLEPGTLYHWRVRPRYDLVRTPFQRYGPWVHVPINGWNEADLRTDGDIPMSVDLGGSSGPLSGFDLREAGANPGTDRLEALLVLGRAARIRADVLDARGRLVAVLAKDGSFEPGSHVLIWDGRERSGALAPSGVYFVRVTAENDSRVRKMVLMR
jgi:hypothetical protein